MTRRIGRRGRTTSRSWSLAATAALVLPGATWAQLPGQDAASTRALAAALLGVELALKERPLAPGRVAEVNRAFDRATLAFFAGQVDAVVTSLAALAETVEPDPEVRARHHQEAEAILDGLDAKGRALEGEGHAPIPYRIHVPSAPDDGPLPVVVVLHGAGGNEHMFLEAYGVGRIRELADELGFIVVSPRTAALSRAPGAFPGLLDAAAAQRPIDQDRVYLLGHSMGAGVAWALAERFPDRVAGVACIAGACGGALVPSGAPGAGAAGVAGKLPPLLVVAGELDPIAAPSRVEGAADTARRRGVDVEFRQARDQGHTLVVGAVLDEVVSWLLARRATSPG